MTDDEITEIQQAVGRALASIKASIKAANESYISSHVTQERLETAVSKALGFPVRITDWDEMTRTATMMATPPINHIDVTFVIESEKSPGSDP